MVATSGGASINSPSPAPQQHGSNSGSKCSHSRSQPAPSNVSAPPFSHHYDHQRSFEDSPLQRQQSISAAPGIAPDSSGMQRATQSGSELLRYFISFRHDSQLNGFSRKTTSRGLMNQFELYLNPTTQPIRRSYFHVMFIKYTSYFYFAR